MSTYIVRICLIAACISCFSPSQLSAATKTFGIVVEAHCQAQNNVCGFANDADLEAAVRQALFDMNEVWLPTGVSFRLQGFSVDYGTDFVDVLDDSLDAGEEAHLGLLNQLRAKAKADPANVYMFILPSLGMCFSGVPVANGVSTANPKMPDEFYGVFCNGTSGFVWAHEVGHHFCLPHPFTFAEPPNSAGLHDGDGIADTPEDPGEIEASWSNWAQDKKDASDAVFTNAWCHDDPESCATTINVNRIWCGYDMFAADPGSPYPTWCTSECRMKTAAAGIQDAPYDPATENIMSYYMGACRGPVVFNGIRHEAITQGQVDKIKQCYATGEGRKSLVQRCGDGDTDGDGMCNDEDPCPKHHASVFTADADGDGLTDECDLCPNDPAATIDTDRDGSGDICDPDDDNDGCLDSVDEHPLEAMIVVGAYVGPSCGKNKAIYAFEGKDTDQDGLKDCEDKDNDNDGKFDAEDECPNNPNDLCSVPLDNCPLAVPWETCLGGGCVIDIFAKLKMVTLPEMPEVILPAAVLADRLDVLPGPGMTVTEVQAILSGRAWGADELSHKMEVELVDGTGQLVASLGYYRLAALTTGAEGNQGHVMSLEFEGEAGPDVGGMKLRMGPAWGAGVPFEAELADKDEDGVPDIADNCQDLVNRDQRDLDQDGFGDRCDPDFDNSGVVDQDDRAEMVWCEGTNWRGLRIADLGQPQLVTDEAALVSKGLLCQKFDLDGDSSVSPADVEIVVSFQGQPPGPSAVTPAPAGPVDPNPDHDDDSDVVALPDSGSLPDIMVSLDAASDGASLADGKPSSDIDSKDGGSSKSSGCQAGVPGLGSAWMLLACAIAIALWIRWRRKQAGFKKAL